MSKRLTLSLIWLALSAPAFAAGGAGGELLSADMGWKTLNFFLLLAALHLFAKKPLTNLLKSVATAAKDRLESSKKQVEAKQQELEEFKAQFAQLEAELEERKNKTLESIEREKTRILEDAKAQAKHVEEAANKRIEQNLVKAKAEIRAFLAEEAANQAEAKIKEQVDQTKRKSLVESYVNNIN